MEQKEYEVLKLPENIRFKQKEYEFLKLPEYIKFKKALSKQLPSLYESIKDDELMIFLLFYSPYALEVKIC
jgi:hypothetical protein